MHNREHNTLNVYALQQNMKQHGDICVHVYKVVYTCYESIQGSRSADPFILNIGSGLG
jgi:hypothetical protein